MTHSPTPNFNAPDLAALAAQMRLMALGLLVELLDWLGAGRLAASLRRRMGRDLAMLERFATGVVVLMALRDLPRPFALHTNGGRRPFSAPPGFARVARDANAMRAMQRKLFPRLRDLKRRFARFDDTLADAARAAGRLARHIERIRPASRLLPIAPPAHALAGLAGAAHGADDSS